MADEAVVHIGENSPEHVAYQLLRLVSIIEGRPFDSSSTNHADRKWLLDTYAECLNAVRNPGGRMTSNVRRG
jgi:hypothetical protein